MIVSADKCHIIFPFDVFDAQVRANKFPSRKKPSRKTRSLGAIENGYCGYCEDDES